MVLGFIADFRAFIGSLGRTGLADCCFMLIMHFCIALLTVFCMEYFIQKLGCQSLSFGRYRYLLVMYMALQPLMIRFAKWRHRKKHTAHK